MKLDFLKFDGEDPEGWVYKANVGYSWLVSYRGKSNCIVLRDGRNMGHY
jgi:hypothetical protein